MGASRTRAHFWLGAGARVLARVLCIRAYVLTARAHAGVAALACVPRGLSWRWAACTSERLKVHGAICLKRLVYDADRVRTIMCGGGDQIPRA